MEELYEVTQVRGYQVRSVKYNSVIFNSREEAEEHLKSLKQSPTVNNIKTVKKSVKKSTKRK